MAAALAKLPPSLKARERFEPETRQIGVTRALSVEDRKLMHLAFAKVTGAERVIDRLYIASNRIQASDLLDGPRPLFLIPRLGVWRQGALELFDENHFLDLPWNLAECDPAPFAQKFRIRGDTRAGEIDVTETGKMVAGAIGELHDQLAMIIQEPA